MKNCQICSRATTGAFYNGISTCIFCQLVLKNQQTSNKTFINKFDDNLSMRRKKVKYGELFINLYPELLISGNVLKSDVEQVRQDILFNYKRICLKMHKDW